PAATSCGAGQTCLVQANTPASPPVGMCPASHPIDCGGGFCCPSGSVCNGEQCQQPGGTTMPGSEVTCSSQVTTTNFGECTLDFCIASGELDCESYYVVNGRRITCDGCGSDTSCVEAAANACAAAQETPAPPPPNESDD